MPAARLHSSKSFALAGAASLLAALTGLSAEAVGAASPPTAPVTAFSARLVDLPKSGPLVVAGMLETLRFRLPAEFGYEPAGAAELAQLPAAPAQVTRLDTLRRQQQKGVDYLRLGLVQLSGQPPQIWLQSLKAANGKVAVDLGEAQRIAQLVPDLLRSREDARKDLPVSELKPHLLRLSYIDADSAIQVLGAMGYSILNSGNTGNGGDTQNGWGGNDGAWNGGGNDYGGLSSWIGSPQSGGGASDWGMSGGSFGNGLQSGGGTRAGSQRGPLPALSRIDADRLPLIIRMPSPDPQFSGLVGEQAAVTRDQLGLTMIPGAASRLVPETISSPMSQLLVLYSDEEQLVRVRRAIETVIDRPAKQIFVEGMVLEISRDGIDQLGVQWLSQGKNSDVLLGKLSAGGTVPGVDISLDNSLNLASRFALRIQALVQQGKAEILSRPSVLTLDNRQATIRVGTDIPIATSKDASSAAEARVSFSFQYLPTGILLNVRPRVESEGREVSMLIDTTVSSTVPGKDLELRSPATNAVLASAPTINTRRVQTYARINNNTPLIIGGLISRDSTRNQDRVPLLGDMPVLGKLFSAESSSSSKREVIIVLTPSVMLDEQSIAKTLPQDKDEFDSFGYQLFRDTYRLRAEDVFDTRYIRQNAYLVAYRRQIGELARHNIVIDDVPLFADLHHGRVPGEEILISGMIHRLISRLQIGGGISPDAMVFFDGKPEDGSMVTLAQILARHGDGRQSGSFFEKNPGKALALSFSDNRRHNGKAHILAEPTPEIRVVDCPDDAAWERLLWEMNTGNRRGEAYTVLLHRPEDINRLSQAIAMKRLLSVNGGERQARIANFLVGRMVSLPDIKPEQRNLLESAVARYFFQSVHYTRSFGEEFGRKLRQIDARLRSPDLRGLVRPDALPVLPAADRALLPAPALADDPQMQEASAADPGDATPSP